MKAITGMLLIGVCGGRWGHCRLGRRSLCPRGRLRQVQPCGLVHRAVRHPEARARSNGPRCSSGWASGNFAYDWRDEHVPTFEEEIVELKKHGDRLLRLLGFSPGHRSAAGKHHVRPQILDHRAQPGGRGARTRRSKPRPSSCKAMADKTRATRLPAGTVQPRRLGRRAGQHGRRDRSGSAPGRQERSRRDRLQPPPRARPHPGFRRRSWPPCSPTCCA